MDLKTLNEGGLIPGPEETEEQFTQRIQQSPSVHDQDLVSFSEWKKSHDITKNLYGFSATWIKACYCNKNLLPWEGAAVWIGGGQVKVQLRKKFKKGSYLKIYSREELLAHEAVHAARTAFQEPRFEELFAYMTSTKKWRRVLGPFFQTPIESLIFLGMFFLSLLGFINLNFYFVSPFFLLLLYGISRLLKTRTVFFKALDNCKNITAHPLAFLLRLTDQEILLFSKSSQEEIANYVKKQTCLRWKMICMSYKLHKI